jgi:hypothetical protein
MVPRVPKVPSDQRAPKFLRTLRVPRIPRVPRVSKVPRLPRLRGFRVIGRRGIVGYRGIRIQGSKDIWSKDQRSLGRMGPKMRIPLPASLGRLQTLTREPWGPGGLGLWMTPGPARWQADLQKSSVSNLFRFPWQPPVVKGCRILFFSLSLCGQMLSFQCIKLFSFHRHLSNIDCLTACTACHVGFICTINGRSKK